MHRLRPWLALLALLPLLVFAACGTTTVTKTVTAPAALTPNAPCNPPPGKGTMGACTPPGEPAAPLPPTAAGARLIPDVSEFQGCALHSEAIFRVYEAGTEREDTSARCHAQAAKRLHVWFAVYTFLRPGHGGCVYQAQRTVAIVHQLGGVIGPIIADAEVPLPPGFVTCFVRTVQHAGFIVVIYTAPGTWPGGPMVVRVWVAAYPHRPPCFSNACPYVAHQFSENFSCRGIRGDCSINEGILSIRRTKPKPPPPPGLLRYEVKRREAERAFITRHHCRQPPWHTAVGLSGRPNGRYEHACHVEIAHGKVTNRIIRDLQR